MLVPNSDQQELANRSPRHKGIRTTNWGVVVNNRRIHQTPTPDAEENRLPPPLRNLSRSHTKRYRNCLLQARNLTRTRGHALRFYREKWLHPLRVVVPDVSQKPQANNDRHGYSPSNKAEIAISPNWRIRWYSTCQMANSTIFS
jgi:hypothetical protein